MKIESESIEGLAEKIDATEEKLKALKKELESISEPASKSLKHRLAAIQIEEHALQRNFAEICHGKSGSGKQADHVAALLHHIEDEEAAIEHEAEFLRQGTTPTLEFAYRIGSRFFNGFVFCIKKLMGKHHLPAQSPFVNTSISSLDRVRSKINRVDPE